MATKSNQNQVDLYFHYQSLLQKATTSQGLEELSPDHVALLVLIGQHWHEGEVVSFEESATDTRKRMITPTKRALAYFSAASKAMMQAVKAA
ncbi:MAG: hypothetical protein EBT59_00785 [Betaproteobacteria bacterium]|nr:hypothetical protein [Betaproteobacteria bacterium]